MLAAMDSAARYKRERLSGKSQPKQPASWWRRSRGTTAPRPCRPVKLRWTCGTRQAADRLKNVLALVRCQERQRGKALLRQVDVFDGAQLGAERGDAGHEIGRCGGHRLHKIVQRLARQDELRRIDDAKVTLTQTWLGSASVCRMLCCTDMRHALQWHMLWRTKIMTRRSTLRPCSDSSLPKSNCCGGWRCGWDELHAAPQQDLTAPPCALTDCWSSGRRTADGTARRRLCAVRLLSGRGGATSKAHWHTARAHGQEQVCAPVGGHLA